MLVCAVCATWKCAKCGWKRQRATINYIHECAKCGSCDGFFIPIEHRIDRIRLEHGEREI